MRRKKEDISYFLAELEKNLNKYHTIIISFVHLPLSSNENTCLKMIKWRSSYSFLRSLNQILSVGIRFVELWPSQEAIHIAISAKMKIALGIIFNFAFNIKLRMCRAWIYWLIGSIENLTDGIFYSAPQHQLHQI